MCAGDVRCCVTQQAGDVRCVTSLIECMLSCDITVSLLRENGDPPHPSTDLSNPTQKYDLSAGSNNTRKKLTPEPSRLHT